VVYRGGFWQGRGQGWGWEWVSWDARNVWPCYSIPPSLGALVKLTSLTLKFANEPTADPHPGGDRTAHSARPPAPGVFAAPYSASVTMGPRAPAAPGALWVEGPRSATQLHGRFGSPWKH